MQKSSSTPLENMQELHEWLLTWERCNNTDKRARDASSQSAAVDVPRRKRVSVPRKQHDVSH